MPLPSFADAVFLVFVAAYGSLFLILLGNVWYLSRHRAQAQPLTRSVSILIPARNEAENLQRLLPSLLEQTYSPVEIIVYNDASTDGTAEILTSFASPQLHVLQGDGPPPGWLGKSHALFQATREATGDVFLFLDADAELQDADALARILAIYEGSPSGTVLTALPRFAGGGHFLVSLLPFVLLTTLPWFLVRRLRLASLGMLNGQCWLIDAASYRRLEPHQEAAAEVLEDVMIARYLKRQGLTPALANLQDELTIHMYSTLGEAWRGFRKNVYLLLGGHPVGFVALHGLFVCTFVVAPVFSLGFWISLLLLKLITDWMTGMVGWHTILTPFNFLVAAVLHWDSAFHHWTKRVAWKGRTVSAQSPQINT